MVGAVNAATVAKLIASEFATASSPQRLERALRAAKRAGYDAPDDLRDGVRSMLLAHDTACEILVTFHRAAGGLLLPPDVQIISEDA